MEKTNDKGVVYNEKNSDIHLRFLYGTGWQCSGSVRRNSSIFTWILRQFCRIVGQFNFRYKRKKNFCNKISDKAWHWLDYWIWTCRYNSGKRLWNAYLSDFFIIHGIYYFCNSHCDYRRKKLSERKNQQNIFCNDRYCTGIRHYIFQSGWRRKWYGFEQPKYFNICICICLRSNCNLCYDSAGNIWVNAAFDFRNLSANCHSNQGYSAFQFSRTANRDRIWIGRGYRSDINYQDHQKSSW